MKLWKTSAVSWHHANRGLLAAIVGMLIWMVSRLVWPIPMPTALHDVDSVPASDSPLIQIDAILRRNLFEAHVRTPALRVVHSAKATPPPAPPPIPKVPLRDRIAFYKLVGILSDTPRQAIVEDDRDQTSSTVKAGDLLGDVLVRTVADDHITLSADGEQMDLSL